MSGYIAIHRKILDSEIFASEKGLKIWLWLLLKARHSNGYVPITVGNGQQTIPLKRGQLIFGRHKAEAELNIDGSTVYKWIKNLQEKGMISLESSSHYTTITILNYNDYQENGLSQVAAEEQPGSSTVAAEEQHGSTNKNDNNEKKVKNVKKKDQRPDSEKKVEIPELKVFLDYCRGLKKIDFPALEFSIEAKYEAWKKNDWKNGFNRPIKNWKSSIKNTIPYLKPMKQRNTQQLTFSDEDNATDFRGSKTDN